MVLAALSSAVCNASEHSGVYGWLAMFAHANARLFQQQYTLSFSPPFSYICRMLPCKRSPGSQPGTEPPPFCTPVTTNPTERASNGGDGVISPGDETSDLNSRRCLETPKGQLAVTCRLVTHCGVEQQADGMILTRCQ
ncbi:hypothetical protein M011DRAFT_57550 [Sporormia fimetaria CBS 119925]|uniref:Uncharacterized protein n=1 Tax=Sporormia fimetaria CBS 119925 TaxID=1340428 RepID=A0A6A6VCC5_9PLEO|nr:hypothetical protein M011DRAFT_57550 [Sporormia fimetaria CBS 119925]